VPGLIEIQRATIYQAKLRPGRLGSRTETGPGSRFLRLDTLNLAAVAEDGSQA